MAAFTGPNPARRCTASRKNGLACKNACKPGFDVCYMHGGEAPLAKAAAEKALALLRHPAIEALYKVMESLEKTIDQFDDDTCATCGYPRGDAEEKEALIKACRSLAQTCSMVLDRTGLGPRSSLEVKTSDGTLDFKMLTEQERGEMMGLLAQLREFKQRVIARSNGAPPTVM